MKARTSAVCIFFFAVACGATVHSTVAPGANLAQYRTYTFHTPTYREGKPESPAEQELREALRSNLAQRGITEAQIGTTPDFYVTYHVKEQQKVDATSFGYGWGWGWGGPMNVTTYTQGTLIVDFVDPRSNQVFWRGTATDIVNHPYAPDIAKLDRAVNKLVSQYPSMMAAGSRQAM